jgi:hypothetical protein
MQEVVAAGAAAPGSRGAGAQPSAGVARPGVPLELVVLPGWGARLPAAHRPSCASWTRVRLLDLPASALHRTAGCARGRRRRCRVALAGGRGPDRPSCCSALHRRQVALRAASWTGRPPSACSWLAGVTYDPGSPQPSGAGPAGAADLPARASGRAAGSPAVLPARSARPAGAAGQRAGGPAGGPDRPGGRRPCWSCAASWTGCARSDWARALAAGAGSGRALQLPGAHNVPYTHPELLSAVLAEAAGRVPV